MEGKVDVNSVFTSLGLLAFYICGDPDCDHVDLLFCLSMPGRNRMNILINPGFKVQAKKFKIII